MSMSFYTSLQMSRRGKIYSSPDDLYIKIVADKLGLTYEEQKAVLKKLSAAVSKKIHRL